LRPTKAKALLRVKGSRLFLHDRTGNCREIATRGEKRAPGGDFMKHAWKEAVGMIEGQRAHSRWLLSVDALTNGIPYCLVRIKTRIYASMLVGVCRGRQPSD